MQWNSEGKPRKPAIIGIGAQKAGTTWLSQKLGQHPHVWAPPFKEMQFFNHRYIEEHRSWLPWHFRRSKLVIQQGYDSRNEEMPEALRRYLDRMTREPMFTNHWYKQAFAPAPDEALPMDVTPEYSTLPEEGVAFVAKFLPKAKFIYVIRHPVDRAISQLKMNITRAKRKPQTVSDWLNEIEDPVLLDRGDYATYVPRWSAHFGPDQLLILPFGQIAADPEGLMRQVEAFLDLPPYEYRKLDQKVFPSKPGLSVPEQARAALRAKLRPQFRFLEQTYGPEFNALLR